MPEIRADSVLSSQLTSSGFSVPVFGLVLTVLHPAPSFLVSFYGTFRSRLQSLLRESGIPDTAYLLYPPESLHCTIATVRPFRKPSPEHPEKSIKFWSDILQRSAQLLDWPRDSDFALVSLREPKVFDDGVGVLLLDDSSGEICAMRQCLRKVFSKLKDVDLEVVDDINMRDVKIPEIVHSTILRWRVSPPMSTEQLQVLLDNAYAEAVEKHTTEPLAIRDVRLLREWEPFMQNLTCCQTIPLSEKREDKRHARC